LKHHEKWKKDDTTTKQGGNQSAVTKRPKVTLNGLKSSPEDIRESPESWTLWEWIEKK